MSRGGRRATDRPGRYPILLIADSYDGARRPSVRYLNLCGFHVEEAVTGDEAIAVIDAVQPHVIVMDLTLPSVSRMINRIADDLHVPILIMATDDVSPILPQAAGVLIKPFSLTTMLEEIRRVLRAYASSPTA